jgi:hypothetical protein
MAWTQTDLDALEAAIAQGALRVRYSDKEVQYRSLAEMLQIRDMMRQELGLNSPGGRRLLAKHSKGL